MDMLGQRRYAVAEVNTWLMSFLVNSFSCIYSLATWPKLLCCSLALAFQEEPREGQAGKIAVFPLSPVAALWM